MGLEGYTVRLQARKKTTSSTTLLDFSSETSAIDISPDEEGLFVIYMSSEETQALVWGDPHTAVRAVYQCEVDQGDGEVMRVLQGTLKIDPEVVR